MRRRPLVLLVIALLAGLVPLIGPGGAQANNVITKTGYIPVAQGTLDATTLHYRVTLPDAGKWGPGPYPTVVDYSGYQPGITIYDGLDHRFLEAGYAVAGVNIRGTGCSGGRFDYFEPLQSRDGAEAIEWLAKQPWSNGRIGMVGKSYPGITQLFVAGQQPPSLKAIVPGHVFGDLYRDVPFPGGIMNATFAAGWSSGRIVEQFSVGPPYAMRNQDQQCLRNQVDHAPNPALNPFVRAAQPQNWWDNELFRERSPWYFADRITAPMMLVESWQDEQVGSRATELLERINPRLAWKFVGTNGDHGEYYGEEVFPQILRFLSFHLKRQIPAGDPYAGLEFRDAYSKYVHENRVAIGYDNGAKGGRRSAFWETYKTWPVPKLRARRFFFQQDGTMTDKATLGSLPPAEAGPVQYRYIPGYGSQERGGYTLAGEEVELPDGTEIEAETPPGSWSNRPPEGTSASFTSPPLAADQVMLGTGSVDLWVSSTAPDTDFEVTLSEVRPDGQEMFVQQGWLRASHRKEDPALSTELRPYQTHLVTDTQPLVPGQATKLRVEIFPFGHVFRAGSKVRVTVAAPHITPDLWGFAAIPAPAVNTIYTKGAFTSSIALPVVGGAAAKAPLPPCTLRNQPCRPEPS